MSKSKTLTTVSVVAQQGRETSAARTHLRRHEIHNFSTNRPLLHSRGGLITFWMKNFENEMTPLA